MPARARRAPYEGPECPRCRVVLPGESMRTGTVVCPGCARSFEATAFQPAPRRVHLVQEVAASGPEGANACANHARNAAVTSCQRCGLFVCSLCDMNIGGASYCPACFDLLRAEGTLTEVVTRTRDYGAMARVAAIVGLLFSFMFLGLPFGVLAMFYAHKGLKQARAEQRSTLGIWIAYLFGVVEAVGGAAWFAFFIISLSGGLD